MLDDDFFTIMARTGLYRYEPGRLHARTNGGLDWLQADFARDHQGDVTHYPAEVWETFFPSIDTILMGRKTYETVTGFDEWPFANKTLIVLSTRPLLMMSESFM